MQSSTITSVFLRGSYTIGLLVVVVVVCGVFQLSLLGEPFDMLLEEAAEQDDDWVKAMGQVVFDHSKGLPLHTSKSSTERRSIQRGWKKPMHTTLPRIGNLAYFTFFSKVHKTFNSHTSRSNTAHSMNQNGAKIWI